MNDPEKFFILQLLREIAGQALSDKDLLEQESKDDASVRYARAYGRASACLSMIRIKAKTGLAFLAPEEVRP